METLKQIQEYLQGKKTYIISVLAAVYAVLQAFDILVLTERQEQAIWLLLGALFGMTINAKLERKL